MAKYHCRRISATSPFAATDRPARRPWSISILITTGAFNRPASVDEGTSICDFDDEEKQHKYTIEASVVHFDHAGKHFQVIDTPGYPDFIGQTIGALRAVDTAADRDQRPVGHRSQHPPRVRRGEEGRPGPHDRAQQDGRRQHRLPRAWWRTSRSCSARPAVLLNVPLGQGADFRGVASTLERARRRGRRPGRSGRDRASR